MKIITLLCAVMACAVTFSLGTAYEANKNKHYYRGRAEAQIEASKLQWQEKKNWSIGKIAFNRALDYINN